MRGRARAGRVLGVIGLGCAALPAVAQGPRAGAGPAPRWQQHVAYDIDARLDEARGMLTGTQRLTYHNRSPDALTQLSLHLHLNAFRPGSRWAAADSAEGGLRRFNDLRDPAHGLNHVRDVRVMGVPVEAEWPFAPDSTIVRFRLPRPLAPGDSMVVELGFDARPSLVPRRQGRRGRHYDFAHWYPKVVVYDRHGWNENPLHPQGEFYGEFGTFRVRLDTPADQVIGATGVPLCGDPGWAGANRGEGPVEYRRDHYRPAPAAACDGAVEGRKVTTWYAEDVHHFALSLSPDYRYEGGWFGDVAVHVLYQPGDTLTWGRGVAVQRTQLALQWLERLFGPYAWPQITNVHRIEGGGTEFPMMMHNGSADQGLIVHELGHNYLMGILANNEWREGWLDEGFTSAQTTWFFEAMGRRGAYEALERRILQLDLDGLSEPTSLESHAYRDFATYSTMIYARGELFFHQLRDLVGRDVMARILRTYYERYRLRHVDEAAFREVAEAVSGRDLGPFFGQWLHGTDLYDYGVGRLRRRRLAGGRWATDVEVRRRAPGRFPVEVLVVDAAGDSVRTRVDGLAERAWVTLETAARPRRVVVDPRVVSHDWNMLNNRVDFRALGGRDRRPALWYLDTWFSKDSRRDRYTVGVLPLTWYNDIGGLTPGVRLRGDYLGRFEQNQLFVSVPTGAMTDTVLRRRLDVFARLQNPVGLHVPGWTQTLEGWSLEGRYGGRVAAERTWRSLRRGAPVTRAGASLTWMVPEDRRYLDPGFYDERAILELAVPLGLTAMRGGWQLTGRASLGAGLDYLPGEAAPGGPPARGSQVYGRFSLEGIARRSLPGGWLLAVRGMGGVATGDVSAPRLRQFYLSGADPLEQLQTPSLRSQGALFRQAWLNYHAPGSGAGVRAVDPRLAARSLVGLSGEVEKVLTADPRRRLFSRVTVAAFGDAAQVLADRPGQSGRGEALGFVADAGVGVRAVHRIGDTPIMTRIDLPVWLNRPALGINGEGTGGPFRGRWVVSFFPAF